MSPKWYFVDIRVIWGFKSAKFKFRDLLNQLDQKTRILSIVYGNTKGNFFANVLGLDNVCTAVLTRHWQTTNARIKLIIPLPYITL